ncbi:MAG: helix-hairpin-helix domain-containing protein [Arcicella sp.]|nr:helix-hairpin-helix domain-containing protein [Arcicella sp.]
MKTAQKESGAKKTTETAEAPAASTVAVAEAPAEVVAPAKKAKKADAGDDLKKIEGIGPKIAELFANEGITTFAQLAETSTERMQEILTAAGSRYASHNPFGFVQDKEDLLNCFEWVFLCFIILCFIF